MFYDVGRIWETVIAVLLAVAGGLARLLNAKDNTRLKLSLILSELFISAFAGLMVLMLARSFGLAGDWLGLVCGIAGWTSPRIIDLIAQPAFDKIHINADDLNNKRKEQTNEDKS